MFKSTFKVYSVTSFSDLWSISLNGSKFVCVNCITLLNKYFLNSCSGVLKRSVAIYKYAPPATNPTINKSNISIMIIAFPSSWFSHFIPPN